MSLAWSFSGCIRNYLGCWGSMLTHVNIACKDRRTAENLDNDSTQPPDDSSTEGVLVNEKGLRESFSLQRVL